MNKFLLLVILIIGFFNVYCFGQTITTAQAGPWNNTNTWSGGVIPTNTNSTEIRINHSVNIPLGYTAVADQVFVSPLSDLLVEAGGILDLQNSGQIDLTLEEDFVIFFAGSNLVVNGTFINRSTSNLSVGSGLSTLSFNSGSVYRHAINGGVIPNNGTIWSANSTLEITGVTTAIPSGLNQTFGNVTYNCPSHANALLLNLLSTTINGNLQILNTNSPGILTLAAAGGTINIGGNFTVSGNSRIIGLNNAGTLNLNVQGDFSFSATAILSLLTVNSPSSVLNLNLNGDFNISSGVLQAFAASGPDVNINFVGGDEQGFSVVPGGLQSTQKYDYTVANSSTVNANESIFVGTGTFHLNAGSQLNTSNANGIRNDGTGTVQVSGAKSYAIGSTIGYTGSNNQIIDPNNGFPNDVDLVINKSAGQANLASDFIQSSNRTLTLTEGTLNIGDGNLLTLNGTVVTGIGGISGGPLSNLTIGGTGPFGTLGFVGTRELFNFTIDRTSSGSVTLGGPLTVLGDFTQTNGELILNGNSLTIHEDFIQANDGTITADAQSTIVVSGSGVLPATISLSGDLRKLTLNRASANFSTGASNFALDTLNLFSGTLTNLGTVTINAGGLVERRGPGQISNQLAAADTYDLVYNNVASLTSGPEFPASATALNNLVKRNTGVVTLNSNSTINGNLELLNGELNAGTQSIDIKGNFVSEGNSVLQNATLTFSGVTDITGSTIPTFGNITVTGTLNPMASFNINGNLVNDGILNSTAGVATFGGNTTISGSQPVTFNEINIVNTLTASASQPLIVNGNFNNSGTFNANSGTVNFAGVTNFSGNSPVFHTVNITGTLNSPATLFVQGNFISNGVFNSNNGIVDMTGSGSRSIGGASPLSLYTLNVSGGTISNNNSAVSVTNGINIGSNTQFDVDGAGSGSLVLESSSASETAYVGIIPASSSITGNITVERYFNVGRFWRYVGSPVTNATVADWQEEFPITGTFSDPSTGTFDGVTLNSSNPSLYYYHGGTSEYVAFPTSGTAASNLIENGRGYTPFLRNNTSNIIGAVTGTLKQQSASLPVEFSGTPSDSWNLVANPYAAPIDWDALGWTKVNVFNELHVPIAETGGFATYIAGVGSNGGSQYIASGQAFWVRTSGASPSLIAVEEIKSVNQSPVFYRNSNPVETFRVTLESATFSDEMVFALRDDAAFSYEPGVDAMRRLNTNSKYTFSSISEDGLNLKINSIPKVNISDCSVVIPFSMESVNTTGDFSLSFEGVENLRKYYSIDIIDSFTGEIVRLNNDNVYTFEVNNDTLSKAENRFNMVLNNKAVAPLENLEDLHSCAAQDVNYSLTNLDKAIIYSVYKDETMVASTTGSSEFSFTIPENLLAGERANFEVYGRLGACDSTVVGFFEITSEKQVDLTIPLKGSEVCSNTNAPVSFNSQIGVIYRFSLGGNIVAEVVGNGSEIFTDIPFENLKEGTNEVFVYAGSEECGVFPLESTVEIVVSDLSTPEIEVNANVLESSIEGDFYQWIYEGEVLEGENNSTLEAQLDGNYEVIVTKGACERMSDLYYYASEITSTNKMLQDQIKLYPNPILDYMNIESNFTNLDLSVFSLDGKLMKTVKTEKANTEINMTDLESGMYYLRVNVPEKGYVTYTIVKR